MFHWKHNSVVYSSIETDLDVRNSMGGGGAVQSSAKIPIQNAKGTFFKRPEECEVQHRGCRVPFVNDEITQYSARYQLKLEERPNHLALNLFGQFLLFTELNDAIFKWYRI